MLDLLAALLMQTAAGDPQAAQPAPRTERVCTRERTGGATRTARALVCRDVAVEDAPPPPTATPPLPEPQTTPAISADADVARAFSESVSAYNRQDLETYLAQFDASAELYNGELWLRGSQAIRERITANATPGAVLDVSDVRTRIVGHDLALVDFNWRVAEMSGAVRQGVGSRVYARTPAGWRVVLAHVTPRGA